MTKRKHRKDQAVFPWSVEDGNRDNGCQILKYGERKIGFIFREHSTELVDMLNAKDVHPFCPCCGKQP